MPVMTSSTSLISCSGLHLLPFLFSYFYQLISKNKKAKQAQTRSSTRAAPQPRLKETAGPKCWQLLTRSEEPNGWQLLIKIFWSCPNNLKGAVTGTWAVIWTSKPPKVPNNPTPPTNLWFLAIKGWSSCYGVPPLVLSPACEPQNIDVPASNKPHVITVVYRLIVLCGSLVPELRLFGVLHFHLR